jgi:hypothetical protein
MKTFTFLLGEKEIGLRLSSSDAIRIETTYKTKLLDYIQDYSITTIVTLLRYMRKGATGQAVSQEEAEKLWDEMVDEGWAISNVITDIIMPACQVSGLLTQSDLQMIKDKKEELKATQNGSVS